jgi:putative FmdB family regulatory protein
MPTYVYECPSCDGERELVCLISERHNQACGECGCQLHLLPSAPALHTFKRGFYEHISHDGVYIDSARDLADACAANNCISPYLEEGPHRKYIRKREV